MHCDWSLNRPRGHCPTSTLGLFVPLPGAQTREDGLGRRRQAGPTHVRDAVAVVEGVAHDHDGARHLGPSAVHHCNERQTASGHGGRQTCKTMKHCL